MKPPYDRNTILEDIAFAAAEMARSSDWRGGMDRLLERLGRSVGVSRVYLFEIDDQTTGPLSHTCRHDWAAEGLERLAGSPRYTNEVIESADPELDTWVIRRRRGELIHGHTRDLTGELRADFDYQQIKSFVSVPIHVDGQWWGHLGFDDCVQERDWGPDEMHLLQATAALITASVAREITITSLRRTEVLRTKMLDVALDAIIMIDSDGNVLEFNPAAESIFGWSRSELMGRPLADLLLPAHLRGAHNAAFRQATKLRRLSHPGARIEVTALRADGSEFPIELTIAQIERSTTVVYVAFVRDLTERLAAQRRLLKVERERANLSRFFSPNVIDQLIEIDVPLSVARHLPTAVLFVDMIGFTRFCSMSDPPDVIILLRDFMKLLSRQVFEHNGAIDKFLGDGLLAVFGAPIAGPRDATNALHCGLGILKAIDRWNVERARTGSEPIKVAIGIHYGIVIQGDIGSERQLEFTVLGDTVNIASRVEGLCRSLDASLLATDDFVEALLVEGSVREAARFEPLGSHALRGRAEEIRIQRLLHEDA